jgi:hypothetical protein
MIVTIWIAINLRIVLKALRARAFFHKAFKRMCITDIHLGETRVKAKGKSRNQLEYTRSESYRLHPSRRMTI